MEQVHGCGIAEVTTGNFTKNKDNYPIVVNIANVDACYTTLPNTFLSVKSADCLPVLIYGFGSKKIPFIAAAHAGRKGTEKLIIKKLLKKLEKEFKIIDFLQKDTSTFTNSLQHSQTDQKKLNIWFGPAICKKCYQINRKRDLHYDLIEENRSQVFEFFTKHKLDPKRYLNLEIENHCTLHEPKKFHSYRATGPGVKMNYSLIGIIE